MTKEDRIKKRMLGSPRIIKYSKNHHFHNTEDVVTQMYNIIKKYIKAVKDRRVACVIDSVTKNYTRRTLMFYSYEKSTEQYFSYKILFELCEYSFNVDKTYAVVHGSGMDMVWSTNYYMIQWFRELGFISAKESNKLGHINITVL